MNSKSELMAIANELFAQRRELRPESSLIEFSQALKKHRLRRVRMTTFEDVLLRIGFTRSTEVDNGEIVVKWRKEELRLERKVDQIERAILEMSPDEYCLMDLERLSRALVQKVGKPTCRSNSSSQPQ